MSGRGLLNVSRETMERLETYRDLLKKWNPRINLVAKSTIDGLWNRHFLDSAQLLKLSPPRVEHWADLGSGGGFPGMVIAIMAMELEAPMKVTLVESDARKSAFLRTVIRETGASAIVVTDRIENVPALGCDVLSARALADLSTLLAYAQQHLHPDGTAIFPKGATWKKEVERAQEKWKFDHRVAKSDTEDGPVILSIAGVARV